MFAVDRRGRGRSGDATDYALEREYEDVVAVVESAGEAVSVLGHSYGGICALEAALLTDEIRKLVLYEPPLGYLKSPPHVVDRLHALLEEGRRDELLVTSCGRSPAFHRSGRVAALAAGLGSAARSGRNDSAAERAAGNTSLSRPIALRDLTANAISPRRRQQRTFQAAGEALRGSAGMSRRGHAGQRHAAMDTATDLFTAQVLSFLEAPERRAELGRAGRRVTSTDGCSPAKWQVPSASRSIPAMSGTARPSGVSRSPSSRNIPTRSQASQARCLYPRCRAEPARSS